MNFLSVHSDVYDHGAGRSIFSNYTTIAATESRNGFIMDAEAIGGADLTCPRCDKRTVGDMPLTC